MEGLLLCLSLFPACVALLVNLGLSLLFFTVDCELSLLSAKNKSSGELHAPCKTRRTRDSRGAPNIRLKIFIGASCVFRVLRVSRGACISPALLFLAAVGDYAQFIFYR